MWTYETSSLATYWIKCVPTCAYCWDCQICWLRADWPVQVIAGWWFKYHFRFTMLSWCHGKKTSTTSCLKVPSIKGCWGHFAQTRKTAFLSSRKKSSWNALNIPSWPSGLIVTHRRWHHFDNYRWLSQEAACPIFRWGSHVVFSSFEFTSSIDIVCFSAVKVERILPWCREETWALSLNCWDPCTCKLCEVKSIGQGIVHPFLNV